MSHQQRMRANKRIADQPMLLSIHAENGQPPQPNAVLCKRCNVTATTAAELAHTRSCRRASDLRNSPPEIVKVFLPPASRIKAGAHPTRQQRPIH